jgi:glycosyltransferase involved in cell wall biosynthesis
MVGARVTVLMPVCNAMPYLRPALLSIQKQTHTNLEILLVDDGSSDGSLEFIHTAAEQDPRIRLISREHRGLVPTLNEGIDVASGDFLARMDADDIAYPDRLDRQLLFMQSEPKTLVAAMGVDYLYGRNRIISKPVLAANTRSIMIETTFHTCLIHPTVMFNTNLLVKSGYRYDERYRHCEDFDLWRRIAETHQIARIAHAGMAWRQHQGSVRSRHRLDQIKTNFSIVSEQLRKRGIASEPASMLRFLLGGEKGAEQADLLGKHLQELWCFPGYTGPDREAYERGLRGMLFDLVFATKTVGRSQATHEAISRAGLTKVLPLRQRIDQAVANFVPERLRNEFMDRAQVLARALRSHNLREKTGFSREVAAVL